VSSVLGHVTVDSPIAVSEYEGILSSCSISVHSPSIFLYNFGAMSLLITFA